MLLLSVSTLSYTYTVYFITLTPIFDMNIVGECGLDYDRMFSPKDVQLEWFEKQVQLACDLQKPLFCHERGDGAAADFVAILSKYSSRLPPVCVHCFTGEREALEKYLELNCYVGITGWICDERRGTHLLDLVQIIPRKQLMIGVCMCVREPACLQ